MIVLDLPMPLSVNRTRRIDWRAKPRIDAWTRSADALVMSRGRFLARYNGPYSVTVILSRGCRIDADNGIKQVIDYLRRIEVVPDDSPKYLRRLIVEFGDAPEGCRVIVEPIGEKVAA